MHVRRRAGRSEAQLALEAVVVEGGLLSPEWLARVAQLTAGSQAEADYRVPKGLNLRDEIGRYWRIAQAHWQEFVQARAAGADAVSSSATFARGLLVEVFGFTSLADVGTPVIAERKYPIGWAALDGMVPVVVAPAGSGLDAANPAFGDGWRRRSAFGLAQEFLNAQEGALWGVACDGVALRLLRDNGSLTRPAWIEADLERIFTEERYADFAALWLLTHESRFGKPGQAPADCALEAWRKAGQEEGTRARDHLRRGFEEALASLGQGFLSHPENRSLRASLADGSLSARDYFNQLLRLVYRLIFLLAVEERDLLHTSDTPESARDLYTQAYSMRRLRDRAVKRSAHDRFSDLWEATKVVFRGAAAAEPRLGLPALAGLFARGQCPGLDASKLENRALLLAVFRLAWLRDQGSLVRVNWRDMGPEELGSVYESLLELVPQITKDGRQFAFASGGETKGNARKTTGSYYTPDSLVQVLLDSALEPVIKDTIARNPTATMDALLGLSIVDPACGSGHFLLAAARRLASHVARLQTSGTPSAAEYRRALRQVVGRCVYGVDLNPMAVELCKVSLWMEAVEPGLPLTFLDSHVQLGNALLGTTPELMAKGIPDAAWDPIEGDDKKAASALKKRNKKAAEGQRTLDTLWQDPVQAESQELAGAVKELDAAPDASPEALASKEARWGGILESNAYRHQKFVADAWCAAFVWPKQPGAPSEAAPTNDVWRQLRDGQGQPSPLTASTVAELAEQYRFFHWHLQFPQVFAKGGFDVVLGNPPWERVKLQEQEFFASRDPQISDAPNAAARKKLIARLPEENQELWVDWLAASRRAEGESRSIRQSGRYPLCGQGDVNTYAVFAEHNATIVSVEGRAGFVVPTGIATDETTSPFFRALVEGRRLISLFDFWNSAQAAFFPGIGNRTLKFSLVVVGKGTHAPEFAFYLENVSQLVGGRRYHLSQEDIGTLNPNTHTCPTFRSRRDADINLGVYRRMGILWHDGGGPSGNPWAAKFMRMIDMATDSGLFRTKEQLSVMAGRFQGNTWVSESGSFFPLMEAKMLHHFNHRFGDYRDRRDGSQDSQLPDIPIPKLQDPAYVPMPNYWVASEVVDERLHTWWRRGWLLGWRDIAKTQNERTVIPAVFPRLAVGHTVPLLLSEAASPVQLSMLCANLCAFVLDYAARQKVGGTHVTYANLKQLPLAKPGTYDEHASWDRSQSLGSWACPRVLELTYTAWDLESFALDLGYDGPAFRWDPERRFLLRCELDAAFFHLYGLSRDDTDYVMDTFPIVRKNDQKAHGEYRTKRVILEVYDEMAEAARTGVPYKTRLDPAPADPRVAHPDTRPGRAAAN